MTTKIVKASSAALLLLLFFCYPTAANWTISWETIQQESGKIQSIEARFTQSKHMKILSKPLVSKGRFCFQAPNAIRWEYESPVKSILLLSGSGVKRYTLGSAGWGEDAAGVLPSMQVILTEIGRWSKGRFTDSSFFSATLKKGKEPQIVLTPKGKGLSSMISRIVIGLAPDKPGVLQSIQIYENEGDHTSFDFSDVQLNGKLPDSAFLEMK